MSVTKPRPAGTPRGRGVLVALVAAAVSVPAGCRTVPSGPPPKPPRLNGSVTDLNYNTLQAYLEGANADGRTPGFRDGWWSFHITRAANKRDWQGTRGRVEGAIMPENDSYRVGVNDPDLRRGGGGMVLAKIRMERGSAPDPLIGLEGGEVGYWFVERNQSGVVRSYVVRERDGHLVGRSRDNGLNFTPCHTDRIEAAAKAPKADFYPADKCPATLRGRGVRQQGAPAGRAALQVEFVPWDACPTGCCIGF